jgi:POT family proton-dependent oligopeptide transporter
MSEAVAAPASGARNELLFGQPKGLTFLFMTEMWERFSFYGMRAFLILYFVQELLLPGHIENVAGMRAFRAFLESLLGPMSNQAFGSQMFGLYAGMVYFTPVFGGLLADRLFGPRRVVLAGIALMTAGHFAMAFEQSVLIALLLLVLGSGCLKGNIAAQVGQLYVKEDEAGRAQGFTIFSTGINIGSTLGPVACGALAQIYGWDAGFACAGVLMLVAAAAYIAGQKHFAPERLPRHDAQVAEPLTGDHWRMIMVIAIVIAFAILGSFPYDQLSNVGIIWADAHVDLSTPFGAFPAAWFGSEDPLASTLIVPFLIAYWRWQAKRGKATGDLQKMATGCLILAAACGSLAWGAWSVQASGAKVPVWFPLVAFALSGIAFMWYWPITLAFVSRHAPPQVKALLMAAAYLALFFSGIGSGYLARFYEPLGPTGFWILNGGIGLTGFAIIMLCAPALARRMARLEAGNATAA